MRTLFSNRLLAYLIDITIIVLVVWFFREIIFGGFDLPGDIEDPIEAAFYFFTLQTSVQETLPAAILIVAVVYIVVPSFIWKGQTIGKKIVGSKVVNLDGTPVSPVQITIRTMLQTPLLMLIIWYATSFMPSPFTFILFMTTSLVAYGLYAIICASMVHSREDYSCVHDMVFNTVVVDAHASMKDIVQQTTWIKKVMEDDSFKAYKHEDDEEEGVMRFNKSSFHLIRGNKQLALVRGSATYDSKGKILHRGKKPERRIVVNKGVRAEIQGKYEEILKQAHIDVVKPIDKMIIEREEKIRKAWIAIEEANEKKQEKIDAEKAKRRLIAEKKLEEKRKTDLEKKMAFEERMIEDEKKKLEIKYAQDEKEQIKWAKEQEKEKTQVIKMIERSKNAQIKKEEFSKFNDFKETVKELEEVRKKRRLIIFKRKEDVKQRRRVKSKLRMQNIDPNDLVKEKSKKVKKSKPAKVKKPKPAKVKKSKPAKVKKSKPVKVKKPVVKKVKKVAKTAPVKKVKKVKKTSKK